MRRIPDVILECKSDAEKKIFDLVGGLDLGSDWTAFHSLNCSEHEYKRWAEIDFLLLSKDFALVLECPSSNDLEHPR